jgi:hypothetical protein
MAPGFGTLLGLSRRSRNLVEMHVCADRQIVSGALHILVYFFKEIMNGYSLI